MSIILFGRRLYSAHKKVAFLFSLETNRYLSKVVEIFDIASFFLHGDGIGDQIDKGDET